MQENLKHNNIHIIGIPEGEEKQGIENLFEQVMMVTPFNISYNNGLVIMNFFNLTLSEEGCVGGKGTENKEHR